MHGDQRGGESCQQHSNMHIPPNSSMSNLLSAKTDSHHVNESVTIECSLPGRVKYTRVWTTMTSFNIDDTWYLSVLFFKWLTIHTDQNQMIIGKTVRLQGGNFLAKHPNSLVQCLAHGPNVSHHICK